MGNTFSVITGITLPSKAVSFTELCQRYGISRKTGYKWLDRYRQKGAEDLADQSLRPKKSPGQLSEAKGQALVALRRSYPISSPLQTPPAQSQRPQKLLPMSPARLLPLSPVRTPFPARGRGAKHIAGRFGSLISSLRQEA